MTLACSLASNARAVQQLQDELPARNTARFYATHSTPAFPPPEKDPSERLATLAVLAVFIACFIAGINAGFVGSLVH